MYVFGHCEAFLPFQNDTEVYQTLVAWRKIVADDQTVWSNLADVKNFDKTVQFSSPYTVFGIRGESYKILTEINYKSSVVSVISVLSKTEFDRSSYSILNISRGI